MPVLVLLAALLLASCAPPSTPANAHPGAGEPSSEEAQACKARGGEMRRICLRGNWSCVETYSDAGKACTDRNQCKGQCRYAGKAQPGASVVGQCQRTTDRCGCHGIVENGKYLGTMCVD